MKEIKKQLAFLGTPLLEEMEKVAVLKDIPRGTNILEMGQYVKVLPIVVDGLVKVYSHFKDRELLLYYMVPGDSCVMSFSASLHNETSKVAARTEEDSKILLLPVDRLPGWLRNYPRFNELFYAQYNARYVDLLDTIQHVLLDKMDKRLYDYLKEKTELTGQEYLQITHGRIANELGTVREVISRVIRKLEVEGRVLQSEKGIKIRDW
jgi:CRP/FNR family transcriptional regulator